MKNNVITLQTSVLNAYMFYKSVNEFITDFTVFIFDKRLTVEISTKLVKTHDYSSEQITIVIKQFYANSHNCATICTVVLFKSTNTKPSKNVNYSIHYVEKNVEIFNVLQSWYENIKPNVFYNA